MTAESEWARCKHWIAAALEYSRGTHTIEDIEAGIAAGQYTFWPGRGCAVITEFIEYPQLKALNFFLFGGDLQDLKEMEPHIVAWAKAQGCTRFMGGGRKGFERVFASAGYEPAWFVLVKDLEHVA